MRIRTQNALAILPLFLCLSLISSALLVHAERGELRWGIREEAASLAVATAEFIDGNRYQALAWSADQASRLSGSAALARLRVARGAEAAPARHSGKMRQPSLSTGLAAPSKVGRQAQADLADLRASLNRILARGQAKRFVVFTADGRRALFSVEGARGRFAVAPAASAPADLPGFRTAMAADRCFVDEIRRVSPARAALCAYAPIHDANGQRVGVLGVETAAREYEAATRRLWLRGAGITGAVLLLGLMVATALSSLVTRETQELTRAAVAVRSGNMDRQVRPGRVQEVADLGNTFNTMADVQQDVLARTRRTLIEGEQFRSEADLARYYGERCSPPFCLDLGGVRVAARYLGAGSPAGAEESGSFSDAFQTPAGVCCAVVGRVARAGALAGAIEASAAGAFLRRELAGRAAETVLADAHARFSFEHLECVCWRLGDKTADLWRLAASRGPLLRHPVSLSPMTALALHTFAPEPAALIRRYVDAFAALPSEELLEDLAAALPPESAGSLLVLRPVTSNE